MNKLLFTLKRDCGGSITLIANNHRDLQYFLHQNYDWYYCKVGEESVIIVEREGYNTEYATLEWVRHI